MMHMINYAGIYLKKKKSSEYEHCETFKSILQKARGD